MASHEQCPSSDLRHQQQEILDYVNEIVQELSEMSARAGMTRLSSDLLAAVQSARSDSDSPQRRISGARS